MFWPRPERAASNASRPGHRGSGNGCLAGYLVKHRYFGKAELDVRVEQGYEIDRPSLIHLRASEQKQTIDVNVGGKVVLVAQGQFA